MSKADKSQDKAAAPTPQRSHPEKQGMDTQRVEDIPADEAKGEASEGKDQASKPSANDD